MDDLNQRIIEQQSHIDTLTSDVIHWRELCKRRTSSTNSNTLHDLLDQLQIVLRLSLDNPGHVYIAVTEAIYANTSPAQRNTIKDAPSNEDEWITCIADMLQEEQTEGSEHDDDSTVEGGGVREKQATQGETSETSEITHMNAPRPVSAKRSHWTKAKERAASVRRSFFGKPATADLSTLLSDLKHVSENDADVPPV